MDYGKKEGYFSNLGSPNWPVVYFLIFGWSVFGRWDVVIKVMVYK